MSTTNPRPTQPTAKPQQATAAAPKTAAAPAKRATRETQPRKAQTFLFDRDNYIMMAAGVLLIFIGFELMSGGKSPDPHKFLYDEIYSFRRITLAPIVVMLGYVVEVLAIMKKPKQAGPDVEETTVNAMG
jgi:hypothetical protein